MGVKLGNQKTVKSWLTRQLRELPREEMTMSNLFREKLVDRIVEIRDACPRDPNDASSDDIGDAVLELFCEQLRWITDQYPAGAFRDRLLTEAEHLRGE